MAPREDLVSSAVTFLQDPSVASSPIEKRIEFLRSKNLTQEEVDASLARAADLQHSPQTQAYASQPPTAYSRSSPPTYPPYGSPYGPYGEWQQPPPEVPRRDWRDWFIMATVTGGAAYGLYVITKRYIAPLISPPTPPQLEADKAAIDEQFTRAFALIETLSADTATIKQAEEARTERLDNALEEVETVVSELKSATRRREDEIRRLNEELRGLKEGIPKALEGHRESGDKRLAELGNELKSLKALMGNRFGGSSNQTSASSQQQAIPQRTGTPTSSTDSLSTPSSQTNNSSTASKPPAPTATDITSPSNTTGSRSSQPYLPYQSQSSSGGSGGKAAIPAWQMAASRKAAAAGAGVGETESGS